MTDFAQELRQHEGLTPTQAIRKAASIRVRPVTMTALAAFFALIPGALALERGSEANAPLARAILGGLLAGEPATLFVLPCLYSLMVRDKKGTHAPRHADDEPIDDRAPSRRATRAGSERAPRRLPRHLQPRPVPSTAFSLLMLRLPSGEGRMNLERERDRWRTRQGGRGQQLLTRQESYCSCVDIGVSWWTRKLILPLNSCGPPPHEGRESSLTLRGRVMGGPG